MHQPSSAEGLVAAAAARARRRARLAELPARALGEACRPAVSAPGGWRPRPRPSPPPPPPRRLRAGPALGRGSSAGSAGAASASAGNGARPCCRAGQVEDLAELVSDGVEAQREVDLGVGLVLRTAPWRRRWDHADHLVGQRLIERRRPTARASRATATRASAPSRHVSAEPTPIASDFQYSLHAIGIGRSICRASISTCAGGCDMTRAASATRGSSSAAALARPQPARRPPPRRPPRRVGDVLRTARRRRSSTLVSPSMPASAEGGNGGGGGAAAASGSPHVSGTLGPPGGQRAARLEGRADAQRAVALDGGKAPGAESGTAAYSICT